MNLATAYAQLGRHEQAIEEFSYVLGIEKEYGFIYAERAYSYKALGEK